MINRDEIQRLVIEPNTEEWLLSRLSKFSSSDLHKLMGTPRTKGAYFSDTAKSHIYEKVADTLSGVPGLQAKSASIDHGHTYEADALQAFATIMGVEINTGMAYHWKDLFCGTPDGETSTGAILEVKCPFNGGNHIENFGIKCAETLKDIRKEYYWQLVGNIMLSGYDHGYFISYNPALNGPFRLHFAKITPMPGDMELAVERILAANKEKDNVLLNLV